eukprot:Nitzschia sp. Nitz4//scaffold64_size103689//57495//59636//NITZ4_004437-RA/size103689-processed-gene-0.189-mRNA-1//-1//CDS//3329556133//2993//frame0
MKPTRRIIFPRLRPRPTMASMLNNKAISLLENRKYAKACSTFHQALRITEKEKLSNIPCGCRQRKPVILLPDNCHWIDQSERIVNSPLEVFSGLGTTGEGDSADDGFGHLSRQLNRNFIDYEEGMDYFRDPFRLQEKHGRCQSTRRVRATILFNLGRLNHTEHQYPRALRYYKRCLEALEPTCTWNEPLIVTVLASVGDIQFCQGGYAGSIQTYLAALAFAQATFGTDSLEAAACLNGAGVAYYVHSSTNLQPALELLKASLVIRMKHLEEDHIDLGTTYNNIGRVHFQKGELDHAMAAYHQALRVRNAHPGCEIDVAATHFNIGQVFHQQLNFSQALVQYQSFLTLAQDHFGEFHRDISIVSNFIGQVLHALKKHSAALIAFKQSLRVGRVVFGPMHSEIAITLNKMGNLYYETGNLDAALQSYLQGLEVEVEVLEEGNPNLYVTFVNIAEIHKQKSEFDNALKYYEKVLSLQRKHTPGNTSEITNTLSNIAYIHHQKGEFDEALEINQECLRLRRDAFGDMDGEVASTLTQIALILVRVKRHQMALEVFAEASRIRRERNGEERDLAFCLYNIALIYHQQGLHEVAMKYYLQTASVEQEALGEGHPDLGITFYNIGQLYYQRGEMELAKAKFHMALNIERGNKEQRTACARTLNEIGNIALQLGRIDEVMHAYSEALRIYRSECMDDDNLVVYGLKLWRFELVHPVAAASA